MTEQEMTYGEMAVGLSFNPSGDPDVNKIKQLYADIIDFCKQQQTVEPHNGGVALAQNERNRMFSIAITEAQTAQMWAVKAITWRYDK